MKYETIDTEQIDQIMEGKVPDPPADWDDSNSGGGKKAAQETTAEAADSEDDKPAIGGTAEQH